MQNKAEIASTSQSTVPWAARVAVSVMFFLNGFLTASWISRIPIISETLHLSKSSLANVLVFMTIGALLGFQLVGFTLGKYGSRTSTIIMAFGLTIALPLIGLASTPVLLAAALMVFGLVNGGMDVAMNAQAVAVEQAYNKPIINSFHAIWSVGSLLGAILGGRMAGANIGPGQHFFIMAALSVLAIVYFAQTLLPAQGAKDGPRFVLPPRPLLLIGSVAFLGLMGEGAMGDWSGVYLRQNLHTTEAFATNGFVATAIAMIVARFSGDALVARFGPTWVVRIGGLVVAIGMAVALLLGSVWATLLGFACVGIGLAVIFPLTFSAAGKMKNIPEGIALPSVSTMGYTGFLVGPIIIGYLAEVVTLRGSLWVLVLVGLVATLLAGAMQPKDEQA